MKFTIKDVTDDIIGSQQNGKIKGHLYSVCLEDEEDTLIEKFIEEVSETRESDAKEIVLRLRNMILKTGFADYYFKDKEGNYGDHVVALRHNNLRLYCIYLDHTAIIVGSGGEKNVRAYQDDPKLNKEADIVKNLASIINKALIDRNITINGNGVIQKETEDVDFLE